MCPWTTQLAGEIVSVIQFRGASLLGPLVFSHFNLACTRGLTRFRPDSGRGVAAGQLWILILDIDAILVPVVNDTLADQAPLN